MADLAVTDWTMVVLPTNRAVVTSAGQNVNTGLTGAQGVIMGKQRMQRVRMTLPSSASLHPDSGIPLPSFTPTNSHTWGMVRNLDYVVLIGQNAPKASVGAQTEVWTYMPSTHVIQGWTQTASNTNNATLGLTPLASWWEPATTYEFVFQAWGW